MQARRRWRKLACVPLALALVPWAAPAVSASPARPAPRPSRRPRPAPRSIVTVEPFSPMRPIPPGFLGVSLEYNTLAAYEGPDPATADPVLAQLIRNLAPGQTPIVRIGGDSTDWTWWPIRGLRPPRGVDNPLTPLWLEKARMLVATTRARVILGINMEAADPRLASGEARALVRGIGARHVAALELGNEPMLYSQIPWYRLPSGRKAFGRPRDYDLAAYTAQFNAFSRVLPALPLAGPAIGRSWLPQLPAFIRNARRLRMVTLHGYAIDSSGAAFRGRNCPIADRTPTYPTIPGLLAPIASAGLARNAVPDIALAHSLGLSFRVDEMNAITCAGMPGVSDTFASALWVLNAVFSLAREGVDGVNVHTWRGSAGRLFSFSESGDRWSGQVRPEYYGLLLFAKAAPAGARLLPLVTSNPGTIEPWATIAPDRRIRVVLINRSLSAAQTVTVRLPAGRGPAWLEALTAPSAAATSGVTLAGRSFDPATTTGRLGGPVQASQVAPVRRGYTVRVPASSALVLTVPTRLK